MDILGLPIVVSENLKEPVLCGTPVGEKDGSISFRLMGFSGWHASMNLALRNMTIEIGKKESKSPDASTQQSVISISMQWEQRTRITLLKPHGTSSP